jgi:Ca2+-transporting ATPase
MGVLALAFRLLDDPPDQHEAAAAEAELTFLGLTAMIDPPRPEVKEAVGRCRTAGIRPVMITGDHPLTAQNIADDLGIASQGEVLTGRELSKLSPDELDEAVGRVAVYARVSPQHKLDIVDALKRQGEIVAMTGDGVNDAPALKKADIGVAMGITGTDVSKEAADMVLLDDNFATNVAAVEEGRVIYDNIRKFLQYTMTSNLGEIWVMLLGPLVGMPLPLLPLQILWINLVTDGLPGLALAVEPGERDTMRRPPYPPGESFLSRGVAWHIVGIGGLMGVVSLLGGWWHFPAEGTPGRDEALAYWRTMVFMVLTLSQMGHVLAIRSHRDSLFRIGLFSNRWLLAAVALTFLLQLAVTYLPPLQHVFHTTALSLRDLAIALALSTIVFWSVEVQKLVVRRLVK